MSVDLTMMHGTGQIHGSAADIDKYVDSEWCPH
jgi:hypothetical protein